MVKKSSTTFLSLLIEPPLSLCSQALTTLFPPPAIRSKMIASTPLDVELSRLRVVSLSEMDSVSLMNRVDTKYVFGESTLLPLLGSLLNDYRVLEVEAARLSPYATLYFDTPRHGNYLQHHNGKLNRCKYRMRSYEASGACFFEIKKKNNKGRTDKRRIPIESIQPSLDPELSHFVEETTGYRLPLTPQLWTTFSRITLVSQHAAERVTIDTNLRFRECAEIGAQEAIASDKGFPGVVIAEVKQERDDRSSLFRQELRSQGIRPLRVSKYCLGEMLLRPDLKSNRFKSKLLAIQKIA